MSAHLAAAGFEIKPEKLVITGEASLSTLLQFQQAHPSEKIIEKKEDICYLHKPLNIFQQSTFHFDGKDCPQLRLYPGTYIRIAGRAYFMNIKVSSADQLTGQPIGITRETHNKIRPHIYTDTPAEYVQIENSEFSYLGSYTGEEGSTWGVSFWHLKSGYVNNSEFHHNYFGIYTWDAKNVVIQNSSFHDNLEYGMDFHDYSDNFVIKNNQVYRNGNHGIIFSKYCDNNKIIGNHVYDHTQGVFVKGAMYDYGIHGIMLHKESNNNLVSENILENNNRAIVLYHSHGNVIEKNIVLSDLADGMYLDHSTDNLIENNVIFDTAGYGLYSYYSDLNEYRNNYFEKGSYFKQEIDGQEQVFGSEKKYLPGSLDLQAIERKNATDAAVSALKTSTQNKTQTNQPQHGIIEVIEEKGSKLPDFTEFISYKRYHLLWIAIIAVIIFIVELLYKWFIKKKFKKSQTGKNKRLEEK